MLITGLILGVASVSTAGGKLRADDSVVLCNETQWK